MANTSHFQQRKPIIGVKAKPITVRNPQANAIVERVHQVIGNIIRTFELENNYLDDNDPWKGILSATAFAVQSTFHTTLQNMPGQLVFGRNMILNVKHEANWEYICAWQQNIILKNNKAENAKRIPHILFSLGPKHQILGPFLTNSCPVDFVHTPTQRRGRRHAGQVVILSVSGNSHL
jgi:hypothetical protein